MQYRDASAGADFQPLYSVLSLLSYMLKAPLVKPGTDVVNSLNRQRNALEAFLKACIGLEGSSDLQHMDNAKEIYKYMNNWDDDYCGGGGEQLFLAV